MDKLGIRKRRVRLVGARVTELVMRLKPNGKLVGYSPLSRVIELETLVIGITGKLELWRGLSEIDGDPRVREFDFADWRKARRRSATRSRISVSGQLERHSGIQGERTSR